MYNLLILGSGRSGTSMATGLFRNSGYFFGDQLLPETEENPFGYFEDDWINRINSQLITRILHWRWTRPIPGLLKPAHRDFLLLWLASPAFIVSRSVPGEIEESIRALVAKEPFCFKDPRFNVTLPFWKPYLPEATRFLVVFREPERTVDSILRSMRGVYENGHQVTPEWCFIQWERGYKRLLDRYSDRRDWMFVDYSSIINQEALPALRFFSGATLDDSQISPEVRRSKASTEFSSLPAAKRCAALHERLRARAVQDLGAWSNAERGSPHAQVGERAGS
jgi:hypothetical protein